MILRNILDKTAADVERARERPKFKEQLSFSIAFAKHFGSAIAEGLRPQFGEGVISGEVPSSSADGFKRVDVSYSTRRAGLGFMISLKSVHRGEREDGNARFTHNLKRNDEELRVEATAFHLRQPYSVLVAVMLLPFEACYDGWRKAGKEKSTSSFARWVEKFWSLKGRIEPEDPPNQFELVFIGLYARDGSEWGFYEVGGPIECPREGRPSSLLDFDTFLRRIKDSYFKRNRRDFFFAGESPEEIASAVDGTDPA